MKYLTRLTISVVLILFGCYYNMKSKASTNITSATTQSPNTHQDKEEIQTLIRQMLKWADSKTAVDLLPILSKDSICTGFEFEKEKQTLEKLRATGFFADEFIANYDHIIHTLDIKIKNHAFDKWNVYEPPTFNFDNDASPWCSCQDNLSWDKVAVKIIKLSSDKGELEWNWGKLEANTDSSWKTFSYKFRVVKVDGRWRISYLQGFDYTESIR